MLTNFSHRSVTVLHCRFPAILIIHIICYTWNIYWYCLVYNQCSFLFITQLASFLYCPLLPARHIHIKRLLSFVSNNKHNKPARAKRPQKTIPGQTHGCRPVPDRIFRWLVADPTQRFPIQFFAAYICARRFIFSLFSHYVCCLHFNKFNS